MRDEWAHVRTVCTCIRCQEITREDGMKGQEREWGDEIMREEDKDHSSDNFFWPLVIQNESFFKKYGDDEMIRSQAAA